MKKKIILKKIKRLIKDDSKPINEVLDYWTSPSDTNLPEDYIQGEEKSKYLFEKIKYFDKNMKIVELGCNVGRNLDYLHVNGFNCLSGIEISSKALEKFEEIYKNTYNVVSTYNTSIEKFFKEHNIEIDLLFTMAVLEHIHTDSEWIFEKMVSQAKIILTIEDEHSISWRHFPRNYKNIFEKLGMKQISFEKCGNIKGFHNGFVFRLFEKPPKLIRSNNLKILSDGLKRTKRNISRV